MEWIKFLETYEPWTYGFLAKETVVARWRHQHTHVVVEPKWNISDYIRKPFMNPILGALHFEHSWHVQIITLRVSFSLNAIGKKDRRIGNPPPPSDQKNELSAIPNETNTA